MAVKVTDDVDEFAILFRAFPYQIIRSEITQREKR